MTFFPFDTQSCELAFSLDKSVVYPIFVVPYAESVDLDPVASSEWEFLGAQTVNYTWVLTDHLTGAWAALTHETLQQYYYPGFKYIVTLKRNVAYYIYNLIIPVCLLTVLTLFSFFEFSGADIRITIGITVCSDN